MKQLSLLFKRVVVWLVRFRHRKGYGVQSPFAYNFICDVVNNTELYYAYTELKAERLKFPEVQIRNTEKIDKLLFRLANFVQPSVAVIPIENTCVMKRYIKAGCQMAECHAYGNMEIFSRMLDIPRHVGMVYLSSDAASISVLRQHLPSLAQNAIVIIENIHGNRLFSENWKELKNVLNNVMTFDLYDVGLILLRKNIPTQHYMVNF